MDETALGKKVVKAAFFLFVYLQFLSLVSFLSYWTTVGVDPSGYFSIQDVLVVSTSRSMPLFVTLAFLVIILFVFLGNSESEAPEGSIWKGSALLAGILLALVMLAMKLPADWDSLFAGGVAFVCYYARFGIANVIKPLRLDEIFGSYNKAFIYVSIVSTGLVMAYPAAIYTARKDMSEIDTMARILLLEDSREYYLIGKIGDYHVVNRDDRSVMVVPNSRIDKIIYQK